MVYIKRTLQDGTVEFYACESEEAARALVWDLDDEEEVEE